MATTCSFLRRSRKRSCRRHFVSGSRKTGDSRKSSEARKRRRGMPAVTAALYSRSVNEIFFPFGELP